MRYILIFFAIFYGAMAAVCSAEPASAQVTITDIVADGTITGTTANLPAQSQGKACVVIYVHTDVWYIHPYANAGRDQSYSMVDPQGAWKLETVKRQFPANKVAALVMPDTNACENVPARINDIAKIQGPVALKMYDLKSDSSQWFGRL